jgi:hypothetical protein
MKTEFFYKSPKDSYFEELRSVCYATKKINQVKSFENNEGNFMTMVQMIHPLAWEVIAELLSLETRNQISLRLEAGGDSLEADFFNIWGPNEAKRKYGVLK